MSKSTPAVLTDFIQQIVRRNQDADFLQLLLTTAIALERQFNEMKETATK